jgi:hypothetical protein
MQDSDGDGLANIGWAVGNDSKIVGYNGTSWTTSAAPNNGHLFGVTTLSTNSAWAIGASNKALQSNGATWIEVSTTTNRTMHAIGFVTSKVSGSGTAAGHWSQQNG